MNEQQPRRAYGDEASATAHDEDPRRLRARLRRYRRLLIGGAVLLVGLAVVIGLAVAPDEPEVEETALGPEAAETDTVTLGTGIAGVGVNDDPNEAEEPQPEPPVEAPETEEGRAITGGEASYYGGELAGRPTASGETFDPGRLTAAHRTLPFGTQVRVTNLNNDRSVIVRVNDRGPYAKRRVIDLSEAAARRIGMLSSGHARVRLQVIE